MSILREGKLFRIIHSSFNIRTGAVRFSLHERATTRSHQTEHGKSVYDETQLFVGQQWVEQNEAHCGQQQCSHSPVKEAKGDKEQRAAQGARYSRVEVPEKWRGLLGRIVKDCYNQPTINQQQCHKITWVLTELEC